MRSQSKFSSHETIPYLTQDLSIDGDNIFNIKSKSHNELQLDYNFSTLY